jgi:predicted nuclease of predicted toxin-antitoxin system
LREDDLKFFADECCDAGIVASLRIEGHDVLYVLEEEPCLQDEVVLQRAYVERRILLTEDKDFGELVYRLRKPAAGIVLIRIAVEQRQSKWPRLKKLIDKYADRLPGHFVVLNIDKFRFRPLLLESPSC